MGIVLMDCLPPLKRPAGEQQKTQRERYGAACQFQVWSPLEKTLPPVVHWLLNHTAPVDADRLAAGSGVAPP